MSTIATSGTVVPVGTELYSEVITFLYEEALRLDRGEFESWLELFAEDITYRMPVRLSRMPKDGAGFVPEMEFFSEDHASLTTRVKRLQTEQAWAEQPNSRARHFISNVLVEQADDQHLDIVLNLLVTRTRDDLPYDMFTGERRDRLRRADAGGFLIVDRLVLLDQTVLHSYNLSIFF